MRGGKDDRQEVATRNELLLKIESRAARPIR
jgi:hypothetical protein